METPSDFWELEVENLPRIYAKVDRMSLGEGNDAVDVLDFFMHPDGPASRQAKLSLFSLCNE